MTINTASIKPLTDFINSKMAPLFNELTEHDVEHLFNKKEQIGEFELSKIEEIDNEERKQKIKKIINDFTSLIPFFTLLGKHAALQQEDIQLLWDNLDKFASTENNNLFLAFLKIFDQLNSNILTQIFNTLPKTESLEQLAKAIIEMIFIKGLPAKSVDSIKLEQLEGIYSGLMQTGKQKCVELFKQMSDLLLAYKGPEKDKQAVIDAVYDLLLEHDKFSPAEMIYIELKLRSNYFETSSFTGMLVNRQIGSTELHNNKDHINNIATIFRDFIDKDISPDKLLHWFNIFSKNKQTTQQFLTFYNLVNKYAVLTGIEVSCLVENFASLRTNFELAIILLLTLKNHNNLDAAHLSFLLKLTSTDTTLISEDIVSCLNQPDLLEGSDIKQMVTRDDIKRFINDRARVEEGLDRLKLEKFHNKLDALLLFGNRLKQTGQLNENNLSLILNQLDEQSLLSAYQLKTNILLINGSRFSADTLQTMSKIAAESEVALSDTKLQLSTQQYLSEVLHKLDQLQIPKSAQINFIVSLGQALECADRKKIYSALPNYLDNLKDRIDRTKLLEYLTQLFSTLQQASLLSGAECSEVLNYVQSSPQLSYSNESVCNLADTIRAIKALNADKSGKDIKHLTHSSACFTYYANAGLITQENYQSVADNGAKITADHLRMVKAFHGAKQLTDSNFEAISKIDTLKIKDLADLFELLPADVAFEAYLTRLLKLDSAIIQRVLNVVKLLQGVNILSHASIQISLTETALFESIKNIYEFTQALQHLANAKILDSTLFKTLEDELLQGNLQLIKAINDLGANKLLNATALQRLLIPVYTTLKVDLSKSIKNKQLKVNKPFSEILNALAQKQQLNQENYKNLDAYFNLLSDNSVGKICDLLEKDLTLSSKPEAFNEILAGQVLQQLKEEILASKVLEKNSKCWLPSFFSGVSWPVGNAGENKRVTHTQFFILKRIHQAERSKVDGKWTAAFSDVISQLENAKNSNGSWSAWFHGRSKSAEEFYETNAAKFASAKLTK